MDKSKASLNISLIKDISIFDGVSNIILQNILSNSKFIKFKKGEIIFRQDEIADYVYIIIEGSVKMFQSNEYGEEMALKIIKKGDPFLEAITFSSKNYPISAQSIEGSLVFSIPISILRENIYKDSVLAINLLGVVGSSSQELVAKIEQLTLKTATQRIGWFLLRLFVEKEGNNKTIELPYDKSLIASYLNMKPETFSRAQKKLKEQGINIGHDVVSISDTLNLCNYCSPFIAVDCKQSTHKHCKFNNDV